MTDMATGAIDTLRYARRLKSAGVPAKQAEAMADAIGSELAIQLATKADLKLAIADLELVIAGQESRANERFNRIEGSLVLLRWMMGFTLAFVVALTWRAFV